MAGGITFEAAQLLDDLENLTPDAMDELTFGVVAMDRSGRVVAYNRYEGEHTGFAPADVIGKTFFESIGPCMNNYLVAQRFADDGDLDEVLDYVFTVRMAPTPVRLRLLARRGSDRHYLVVAFP